MEHKIICGDCLEAMDDIETKTIDMILCDLPYGTTACNWDTVIPFEPLWERYKRIIKDNGAIVLTASQPFTSALIMSNPKLFKYEWTWEKSRSTGFLNAKKQPLKIIENICVFYKKQCIYNPQMKKVKETFIQRSGGGSTYGKQKNIPSKVSNNGVQYPYNLLKISSEGRLHPTQKPVALFEYLIKTYTNEGDLVLDNCIGSGTTLIACENLKRNSIGIDISKEWCEVSYKRLNALIQQTKLNEEISMIEKVGF